MPQYVLRMQMHGQRILIDANSCHDIVSAANLAAGSPASVFISNVQLLPNSPLPPAYTELDVILVHAPLPAAPLAMLPSAPQLQPDPYGRGHVSPAASSQSLVSAHSGVGSGSPTYASGYPSGYPSQGPGAAPVYGPGHGPGPGQAGLGQGQGAQVAGGAQRQGQGVQQQQQQQPPQQGQSDSMSAMLSAGATEAYRVTTGFLNTAIHGAALRFGMGASAGQVLGMGAALVGMAAAGAAVTASTGPCAACRPGYRCAKCGTQHR